LDGKRDVVTAMNKRSRKVFERARELLDRVETQRCQWEAEAAMRDPYEVEAEEADALLTRTNTNRGLVFKTKEAAIVEQPARATATMDEATQAAWNAWCDSRIQRRLESFAEIMGDECARMLRIERNKLRKQIAELRRELNAARASNITPLRGRDVA
jgi:hypothetical protein